MMRTDKRIVAAAAMSLAVGVLGLGGVAFGQAVPPSGFFAWDQPSPSVAPQANYTPSPELNNSNSASVLAQLAAAQAAGKTLAVRVVEPLTNPASVAVFNKYAVKYVFTDYEDAARVGRTRALADQVLASTKSKNAYVGNFNFYPNAGSDTTRPNLSGSQAPSFQLPGANLDYSDSRGRLGSTRGNQTAAPALYPGAPDYRNPAAGNSNAPNIRSALFTLPIERLTFATNGLLNRSVPAASNTSAYNTAAPNGGRGYGTGLGGPQAQLVPWVTRFNNYGNASLGGGPDGSGFVQNAANPANGQLLSRGDFEAQVLHYRLRGATSFNLFNEAAGSVVGYGDAQEHKDAAAGWAGNGGSNNASVSGTGVLNGIFSRHNYAFANLSNAVGIGGDSTGNASGGSQVSIESAGSVWSGVYDRSGGTRRLVILMSNLSASTKNIDLPNVIGGFRTLNTAGGPSHQDDYNVAAGQHRLLAFTLQSGRWRLNTNEVVFADDNRNGVGIPEPTTASLLGIAAVGLLARRRRQA